MLTNLTNLSRFNRIQAMHQMYWNRLSKEYLPQLQQRLKWKEVHNNVKTGTLVLIKDDNLPSLKWSLGRISEVHVGEDNKVRVVTLKTANGYLKRAVMSICPLPADINQPPIDDQI